MTNYENIKHDLRNQGIILASLGEIKHFINQLGDYDDNETLYDEDGYIVEYLIHYIKEALEENRFFDAYCYSKMLANYYSYYIR